MRRTRRPSYGVQGNLRESLSLACGSLFVIGVRLTRKPTAARLGKRYKAQRERGLVIQFILGSAFAGLVGAACMALFMTGITRMRIVNADMIRAIGSLFTGSNEAALRVGGFVHAVSGVVFAMIYATVLSFFSVHGFWYATVMSGVIGFVHGFVVFFLLINMVAEHHPLPEFREVGVGVAVAHLVGHIIYGLVVGMILGGMNLISILAPPSA